MRRRIIFTREQMSELPFEDVRRYLNEHGWQYIEEASRPGVGVYRKPDVPEAEILLPLSRHWVDYHRRIADALNELSAVEQRPVWEIYLDLTSPGRNGAS